LNSQRDALRFDPVLLPEWQGVRASLVWRGAAIDLRVDHEDLEVCVRDGEAITAGIGDDVRSLARGEGGRWRLGRHTEDLDAVRPR
jgi:cellobiose phosphorylase